MFGNVSGKVATINWGTSTDTDCSGARDAKRICSEMQRTEVLGNNECFLLNAHSTPIDKVRLETLLWCRMAVDRGMKGWMKGVQPAWRLVNGDQARCLAVGQKGLLFLPPDSRRARMPG